MYKCARHAKAFRHSIPMAFAIRRQQRRSRIANDDDANDESATAPDSGESASTRCTASSNAVRNVTNRN